MIGYILFYELPIIIRWQWRLCCVMSAMLGYLDFCSYRWQWMLCCTMKHFSCSNCIADMLLKARGWRGTSLPRESDNAWFSNPIRVLFLPITWRIWKSWTRSGFTSCVYSIPTLASEVSLRGAFKSTTRTELRIWKTTTHIINIRLLRVQSIPNCSPTSLLLFCHMVIMMKQ